MYKQTLNQSTFSHFEQEVNENCIEVDYIFLCSSNIENYSCL